VTVSKVREGLTTERLGPFWGAPRQADRPQRAEALAWARRQLLWERRLAALQGSQARTDDERRLDAEDDVVPGGAQAAQGESSLADEASPESG
jgi:transposase